MRAHAPNAPARKRTVRNQQYFVSLYIFFYAKTFNASITNKQPKGQSNFPIQWQHYMLQKEAKRLYKAIFDPEKVAKAIN